MCIRDRLETMETIFTDETGNIIQNSPGSTLLGNPLNVVLWLIKEFNKRGIILKAGDRIIAVNGEDATSWSVLEAVNKIRGPEGTDVTLTVEHVGSLDTVDITITRTKINIANVWPTPYL